MDYEKILRTPVIIESSIQTEIDHMVSSIKKQKEEYVINAFQNIGINPNVVIEQQKEINELRAFIESKLPKWHVVAEGDFPKNNIPVLTVKNGTFSILKYNHDTTHWYEMSGNWWWNNAMVDAWMPLPNPFKKENE